MATNMKPTVYIETSVVSYLTARPSRDVVIAAYQHGQSEPYLSRGFQCEGGSWLWCPRAEGKGS